MLTPTSGTLADYNAAVLAGNQTHARLVFPVQNITLTDNDISINGGISLTSILNPEEDLVFGRAVMSELQVKLLNGSIFNGFDWTEEFHLDFGVEMNGSTNWVTVGYFKGKKPRRTVRIDTVDFIAYDRMQAFDVMADDFLANEVFPITMENLYHDLCTYCGVNYAVGNEMADSMALTYAEDPFADGITCRMILAWIAEANGCIAKINAAGEVKLTWYTDQTSNYSINESKYFGIDIDEIQVPVIDSVRFSSTDTGITGFLHPLNGTNPYEIIDNPLLMFLDATDKTTVATNMVGRLAAFGSYTPIAVNAMSNWMIETGDIIEIGYDNGSTMNMPVFNKIMEWVGTGVDYYECVGNAERQTSAESAKDKYVLGGKLSDKYTIRSGIDITDEGITVSGGKFIKLLSGGNIDIQASNFVIDSLNKIIRMVNGGTFDVVSGNIIISSNLGYITTFHSSNGIQYYFGLGAITTPSIGAYAATGCRTLYNNFTDSNNVQRKNSFAVVEHDNYITYDDVKYTTYLYVGTKVVNGVVKPCIFAEGQIADLVINNNGVRNFVTRETDNGVMYLDSIILGVEANAKKFTGDGVKNNLTTTAGGYVLDARQGKVLNDKVEKRGLIHTTVSASGTRNITLDSAGRYFFIFCSAASGTKGAAIVATNNSGSVSVMKLGEGSSLSFDTSTTNVLKVTNGTNVELDVFYEKLQ